MKKLFGIMLLAAAMLLPVAAHAQFRYGVTAGVSVNDLKFKQKLMTVDKTVGYSAGIAAEMMFPGIGFGLDLGVRYEQRGAKLHMGERELWQWQGYGTETATLHDLDLPVHLKFKYTRLNGFENTLAPFVYAGPTFSFIVGHSNVDALSYAGGAVGIEMGLGAEVMKRLQVSAAYNMGVTYALKTKILTDYSARSNNWDVRLTYFF